MEIIVFVILGEIFAMIILWIIMAMDKRYYKNNPEVEKRLGELDEELKRKGV